MKKTYQLIWRRLAGAGGACRCGMQHWHNALAVTTLLTSLGALALEQPNSDRWVLQLCYWLGSHGHWPAVAPA